MSNYARENAYTDPNVTGLASPTAQPLAQTRGNDHQNGGVARNIALQPEALKLSRRLGRAKFSAEAPPTLILTGVLTMNTERQTVAIARTQNARGERVEVTIPGISGSLSWEETLGALHSTGTLNLSQRTLLERLTFDSADQFILAQLRGASYYVVARNVRPDEATENYPGPLWDVVRVDDPEPDEQKRSLSRWRLYYLNSVTGLIDKVVCDSQGQRIEANLSDWTERSGEKFPSTITWTSQGETLMTFTLTNVSFVAQ